MAATDDAQAERDRLSAIAQLDKVVERQALTQAERQFAQTLCLDLVRQVRGAYARTGMSAGGIRPQCQEIAVGLALAALAEAFSSKNVN